MLNIDAYEQYFPDEDVPLQKQAIILTRATRISWNSLHQNSHSPEQNPLQKMVKLSARSSCTVWRFNFQLCFPRELSNSPNTQHSSLEITVIIRSNFPMSCHVPTQEVLDLAEYLQLLPRRSSSCYISSWPLSSRVSQDLLCFSQHITSETRGVRGIKQPKPRLTTTNETPSYLSGSISSPRSWSWSSRGIYTWFLIDLKC